MNIESSKIKDLIFEYGKSKGYDEKSYITRFCNDFDLNYVQWSSYARGSQKAGIKIIYHLMDIFPDLNMNWLLKDDSNLFIKANTSTEAVENIIVFKKEILKSFDNIEALLDKAKVQLHDTIEDLRADLH